MHLKTFALGCTVLLTSVAQARAQDATLESKLRDLLRQSTVQLRAAQDSTATLQASLDAVTKQRDQLQAQLAEAQAKPAAPAIAPQQQQALAQTQAQLAAARAQNAAIAAGGERWQKAYQDAASIARDKDASDKRNAAGLKLAASQLQICKAANTRLIATAEDILHLYETPKFRGLLVTSHESLLGFRRVELENLVQDYDDRIQAQAISAP